MKIEVVRTYFNQNYTKGVMLVDNKFFGYTLEPQTKGSDEISCLNRCIDTGKYVAVYEYSPKFKQYLIELKNVPNHTEIKIHAGNFRSNTRGCILVGLRSIVGGVLDSKIAVDALNSLAKCAKNSNVRIAVEVREYLNSDNGINFSILQESRK